MSARVRQDEFELVDARLSAGQAALFRRMARCDQRHCLDVYYTLYQAGHRGNALLQAALIHDAGKSAGGLTVWHRVAVVLLGRFAPAWMARLAADGRGWKTPFAVHARHAHTSAQWATQAGCDPDIVALICEHHAPEPTDKQLAALKWADEQN